MCPGWLLGIPLDGALGQDDFENLVFVLGHELGHRIDSRHEGIATYAAYAACLNTNHAASLQNPNDVPGYLVEITADYWASKVLAEYLKSLPFDDRLRAALGCGGHSVKPRCELNNFNSQTGN